MLAVDVPTLGIYDRAPQFWRLRISKTFDKPEYYIGQTVLHRIRVRQGEILHPVTVVGIRWSGADWAYAVEFPEDHPQFEPEDHAWDELGVLVVSEQKTGLSLKVLLHKDFLESCSSSFLKSPTNLLTKNQGFQRMTPICSSRVIHLNLVFCSNDTCSPTMASPWFGCWN